MQLDILHSSNGASVNDNSSIIEPGAEVMGQSSIAIGDDHIVGADILHPAEYDALATPEHHPLPKSSGRNILSDQRY